jgi:hypothetical protein
MKILEALDGTALGAAIENPNARRWLVLGRAKPKTNLLHRR